MKKKEKMYSVVSLKGKKKTGEKIRVVLNEKSDFPGVIFEFTDIRLLPEATKDGNNCEIKYNVLKVPRGKYKDIEKSDFDDAVKAVFTDLLNTAFKDIEKAKSE
jgi:hypothetical protein